MTERDFEKNPYSADERRVAAWICENLGVGGGDDPIGFLLASWEFSRRGRERTSEHET